ncbi:MAG: flagellar motor switch protein FliG [Actinobacteria bacterium]|jgi:flagellar motor switch protein FliG|nr:flagellar motor switch protein FliG [Actinomycetota bacterium]MCL6094612.1 flagellar motor switch protein FliG [Actinomycetota bacterium]
MKLTGPQKAAAMLAQMGMYEAAKVLKSMTENEVVDLMAEMAKLPPLSPETVKSVVREFVERATARAMVGQGGVDAARKLLVERLGPAKANEVLEQFAVADVARPLSFLQRLDPVQVASFLLDEHPQTIAVVLAHLPPEHTAQILKELGEELRVEVVRRIGMMNRVSPQVVENIAEVLSRKLSTLVRAGGVGFAVGGVPALVSIFNNIDRSSERQILSDLEERDPELADEVRSQLFVFDDVVKLDDRTLQRVLRNVVIKDLAVALKGVEPEVREKFMRNMSERAAADLAEEIELLGPTRISAVEAAQAGIGKLVREMEAAGEIVIARGEDELVV